MRTARFALPLVLTLASAGALADDSYFCRQLDIPGSSKTQAWQINNLGQVAATGDGDIGFIYSAGAWQAMPTPPPDSGFTSAEVHAYGLNDFGMVGGGASATGATFTGFILFNGDYHFFSSPLPGSSYAEVEGLNNSGIATVQSFVYNPSRNVPSLSVALVYNPGGLPPYQQGFTEIDPPELDDGTAPDYTKPGQMNSSGTFVGNARYPNRHGFFGFIHDPQSGATNSFRVGGFPTWAPGINNHGDIVGAVRPGYDFGKFEGFLRTAQGDAIFHCAGVDAAGGLFPKSINDNGLISGAVFDVPPGIDITALISGSLLDVHSGVHGFIGYPSVAAALADLRGAIDEAAPDESAQVQEAESAYAGGNIAGACGRLEAVVSQLTAQSGQTVQAQVATSLTAEAQSIIGAACPR